MTDQKQEVKIVDVRELPSGSPERIGRLDKIVTYSPEPLKFYIVTLPAETFTEDALRAAIKKDLASKTALLGKPLTL